MSIRIKAHTIGVYVGLNSIGEAVQFFDDAEAAWKTEEHLPDIVSVGFVTATPIDYDELFNEDEEPCPVCEDDPCNFTDGARSL